MPELVALDAVGTRGFVDAVLRVWDAGDAVLPIDPRLSPTARQRLLAQLGAAVEQAADGSRRQLDTSRPCERGDALVVATSGTTADPKGVVLTHDALAASAAATNSRLGIDASDRWLACLPLSHMGGMGVVVRALAAGTGLTMALRPDEASIADALADGCTRTALVATVLTRVDTSGFTTVLLGGGPAPTTVPDNAVVTYGLTESGGGVVYDGQPLDGVEVSVVDGTIRLRCPMLARAYRASQSPAPPSTSSSSSASTSTSTDGSALTDDEGWFDTCDVGHLEADGRLVVQGRSGDMIVTGGEKVWPSAVESVLAGHPAVAEVAVIGRPDAEWGQIVVAVVVPTDQASPPGLDVLRAAVAEGLAPWAAPRHLELVDALPRTALGKVARHLLA
jgi:O-succinylbenzoic acid--CoA ligase